MNTPDKPTNAAEFLAKRDSLAPYLERVAPRKLASLVRAGDLSGAQQFLSFLDSPAGRNHTSAWATAMDRTAAGDFDAAIPLVAGLSGAKATRLDDGNWRLDIQNGEGQVTASLTGAAENVALAGVAGLAPDRIFKENTMNRLQPDTEQLDALTGERNVLLKQAVQDARQTKGASTK